MFYAVIIIFLALASLILVLPWGFRIEVNRNETWQAEIRIFLQYWRKLGIVVRPESLAPEQKRKGPAQHQKNTARQKAVREFYKQNWPEMARQAWSSRRMLKKYLFLLRDQLHWQGLRGKVAFGAGDPATTGVLWGLWLFLGQPLAGKYLQVKANFWSSLLKVEVSCEGYIIPLGVIKFITRGIMDRELRRWLWRWYKKYRREVKTYGCQRESGSHLFAPGKTFYH